MDIWNIFYSVATFFTVLVSCTKKIWQPWLGLIALGRVCIGSSPAVRVSSAVHGQDRRHAGTAGTPQTALVLVAMEPSSLVKPFLFINGTRPRQNICHGKRFLEIVTENGF
jgi:hypothetical protein